MTWFYARTRVWRAGVLALFAVAMIGPWVFDVIYVPEEYACSLPTIRLEGNYCGMPMSGMWMALWMGMGAVSETLGLIIGTTPLERWWRGPIIGLSLTIVLLPLFTTQILAWVKESQKWQQVNLAAWFSAGIVVFSLILVDNWPNHPALWGLWVFRGLAVAALILELVIFGSQRWLKI